MRRSSRVKPIKSPSKEPSKSEAGMASEGATREVVTQNTDESENADIQTAGTSSRTLEASDASAQTVEDATCGNPGGDGSRRTSGQGTECDEKPHSSGHSKEGDFSKEAYVTETATTSNTADTSGDSLVDTTSDISIDSTVDTTANITVKKTAASTADSMDDSTVDTSANVNAESTADSNADTTLNTTTDAAPDPTGSYSTSQARGDMLFAITARDYVRNNIRFVCICLAVALCIIGIVYFAIFMAHHLPLLHDSHVDEN